MTRRTHSSPSLDESHDDSHGYTRPSKSQRKRDMHALQALGDQVAELPKDAFKRMPLPEALLDALTEARRITDHEGRRRQMQYVGKVMRSLEEDELAALQQAMATHLGDNRAETARLHAIERWRERLLADDAALTDFLSRHPGVDVQQGRTLIRNARREAAANKAPRYFRELFQWIKAALGAPAGGAPSAADEALSTHDREDDDDDA